MDLNNPWVLMGAGALFCLGGMYMFHRNAFEEGRSILRPVLIVIAGVTLVSLGMAKLYHVI